MKDVTNLTAKVSVSFDNAEAILATPPTKTARDPVAWFGATELFRTGVQVGVSEILGRRFDRRVNEALEHHQDVFDYSKERSPDGLWVDYVADVGDGFNATLAVAALLARDIEIDGETLKRSRLLVMGGDEVYPAASRQAYLDRLVLPYELAFGTQHGPDDDKRPPDLLSIPGNHDWYDGLPSFLARFCQQRHLGSLSTKQTRSYFAAKLRDDCWLLGLDIHLSADIDRPQCDYMADAIDRMARGDRVIICVPQPSWLASEAVTDNCDNNILFLERQIQKREATIVAWIAGDLHHYQRHTSTAGPERHRIVAGGGGAFLHPTHTEPKTITPSEALTSSERRHAGAGAYANAAAPDAERSSKRDYGDMSHKTVTYERKVVYPSPARSRRIAFGLWKFPVLNVTFLIVLAVIYGCLGWFVASAARPDSPTLRTLLSTFATRPTFGILILGLCIGTTAYAWAANRSTGSTPFAKRVANYLRVGLGLVHGIGHVVLATWLSLLGLWLAVTHLGLESRGASVVFGAGTAAVGGAVLGSLVFALYLLVMVQLGRQSNDAFAGIRHEGYRNFLRLHITDERIAIYALGVDTVPRWKRRWLRLSEAKLRGSHELVVRCIDHVVLKTTREATKDGPQ